MPGIDSDRVSRKAEAFLSGIAADIQQELKSSKSVPTNRKMEIAPLRSMDDFIMAQSRFQVPDINNAERWFNRIVNNLLYYQTNYFLSGIVIFLLVTFFHPQTMAIGLILFALMFGLFWYAQQQQQAVLQFKREHPFISFVLIVTVCHYLIYKSGALIVVCLGIALPITFAIVHASLRLRNVKNKLVNVTEAMGLSKQTPMSIILNEIGIETEIKMN